MCRFDSAENCIFGFFTGDFQSHEKTKILFSKSVLASFIFHSRLIRSVSADREDLQSDRRHRRAVSRFFAHRGPAPAPCCVGQVVVPSGFTPGSGPARGLSEGGIWKANGSSLGHLLYIAAEGLKILKKVGCRSQSVTSASLNFPRTSARMIRGCSFVAMSRRIAA